MPDKHLSTQFDSELNGVSSRVMELGGLVESQIRQAMYALSHYSSEAAARKAIPEAPEWIAVWNHALKLFLHRDWEGAEAGFREVIMRRDGDPPSTVFLEFVRVFRTEPPAADWLGTVERHEK